MHEKVYDAHLFRNSSHVFVSVAAADLVTNHLVHQLLGNKSQLIERHVKWLNEDDSQIKFKTKIRIDVAFGNFLLSV